MFLSGGKVVFSLFIILFKFSRFTFFFVSICAGMFGCVLSGCVAFHFPKLAVHFVWAVFI